MRKRYGDPMSLPKMDGKPVLATGSVEGLRALFAVPPETFDQMLVEQFAAVLGELVAQDLMHTISLQTIIHLVSESLHRRKRRASRS
jgi:hypothetical protein